MTHDPLCPELWRWDDGQPCMFCALVARAREDERAAALRDAVAATRDQRSKFKARDWDDAIDAVVAAIEALGGER